MATMFDFIQDIDFQILDFIQEHFRSYWGDRVMVFFTYLGSAVVWVIFCAILLLIRKTRRDGIVASCGLLTGVLVANVIIKNIVQRARPCWIRDGFPVLIKNPKDYSFPSGHTMAATVFTVIMIKKHPRLAFVLVPIALLIAFSRLYLYVHFPSDVLFSFVTGILVGLITFHFEDKIPFNRSHTPSGE